MYHYTECGLDYIYLLNGYEVIDDPEFGECTSIHDIEELHKQIAKNIIEKSPVIRGQEVRFFRSEFKLTQTQMAILLGADLRTVQRWESEKKNDPIPSTADKFIRLFYYAAYAEGDKVTATTSKWLKEAHDLKDKKNNKRMIKNPIKSSFFKGLNFSDTKKGWQPKAAA